MAGGVGSRFWPMSTPDLPKQFHDVLGLGKTLIRMTFERVLPICLPENVLVVTNNKYAPLVKEQLPEIDQSQILGEPMMRNTAPCLAYANFWISKKNKNAQIIVLSADQLITNESLFISDLNTALKAAEKNNSLVTLGIKPTHPNTGYGYIEFTEAAENEVQNLRKVKTFTEKPNLEKAQEFFNSKVFYWNAGIFIWSLTSIQNEFKTQLSEVYDLFSQKPEIYGTGDEENFISEIYPECPNISIDYGIMENAENVEVVLSNFGWSDLGTWGSVYDNLPKDSDFNAFKHPNIKFIESKNNVVKIDPKTKAIIQGLDNFIVVESNGYLLICEKNQEQNIKAFSKLLDS